MRGLILAPMRSSSDTGDLTFAMLSRVITSEAVKTSQTQNSPIRKSSPPKYSGLADATKVD